MSYAARFTAIFDEIFGPDWRGKPRIRKVVPIDPSLCHWQCIGRGATGRGITPALAYERWLAIQAAESVERSK